MFGSATAGVSPDRTFVMSWVNNPHRSCGASGATFTAKLSESTGVIEIHYQDTTLGDASCNDGASATVGISDSSYVTGSVLDVGCDTAGLAEAGYAVRFEPPITCADADGDGYMDEACGGDDCDDTATDVNPAADEVAGNGLDDDCDGVSD